MKLTRTNFKTFLKKNQGKLFINCKDSFDGMVDCVMPNQNAGFKPAQEAAEHYGDRENDFGIAGLWAVGRGGDYFTAYEDEQYQGIEISNCCGTQIITIRKEN